MFIKNVKDGRNIEKKKKIDIISGFDEHLHTLESVRLLLVWLALILICSFPLIYGSHFDNKISLPFKEINIHHSSFIFSNYLL